MRCTGCGKGSRKGDRCAQCRRNGPPRGLTGGQWVVRPGSGGVRVWVPDPPPPPIIPDVTYLRAHTFCDVCAALLRPAEWCPCSRAWARAADIAHSWAPIFSIDERLDIAA